jgi:hypothetical protein
MRLRREPDLDPETRRELEALDAALAGQAVDPCDEELAALAVAVRDQRPAPRPEFALDLDLRARDGFAEPEPTQAAPSPQRPIAFRRRWALVLGTAASLFIVATAVFSSGVLDSGGGTDERAVPAAMDQPAGDSGIVTPLSKGGGSQAERLAPPGPGVRAPGSAAPRRQVEYAASVTVATPRDEIEEAADRAVRITDRHGGIVMSSNVSLGDEAAGATLDLRVPADRLRAAMADLSELGHVRSRTQESADITAAFTSPRRRLADALAERRGLLRRLAAAVTPNETAAVRARLRAVNRRIDRAQRELRRLRDRVSFAAVSVAIEPGAKAKDDGGWTIGDAAGDALGVLRALLGATLVGLAVLVPAAALAAVGRLAHLAWVRRRRESALDV